MNRKIFSFLVGLAMAVAGMTVASCGKGDDNGDTGSKETAYLTPEIYVSEAMLEYYDATCTIDGKTVTLTKENTVAEDMEVGGISFHLRKYTGAKKAYTSFPATMVIKQNSKPKAGVDLKTIENLSQFAMYTCVDLENNYADGTWLAIDGDIWKSAFKDGVHFNEMSEETLSKYSDATINTTLTLSSYRNVYRTTSTNIPKITY